jgi:hypothetical protein
MKGRKIVTKIRKKSFPGNFCGNFPIVIHNEQEFGLQPVNLQLTYTMKDLPVYSEKEQRSPAAR